MATDQVQLERRAAQRFEFHLLVSVRLPGSNQEGSGFTHDLSARGAFFYTEFRLAEADAVELTLVMPSEITLAESMRVRCPGRVTRVVRLDNRFGIAVHLEKYEFLPESDALAATSGSYARISALHEHHHEEKGPRIAGLRDFTPS
jgi:PilZ domain